MNGKKFQLVVLIGFIAAAIIGVMVFAGVIPIGKKNAATGTVVLWGTIKNEFITDALQRFNDSNPTFSVKYIQKSADTFNQDLLEALASGTGPDMFFLPNDLTFHYKNKIFTIPYQSFPLATFKNSFAGAGEVFLTSQGVLAFPVTIDPMVMYYNRSLLDAAGIVAPPVYWDEFFTLAPTLTKKDETGKIVKSAVALGQFSNVDHAKDIVSTLFMQARNPIVTEDNGVIVSSMGQLTGKYTLGSMLEFYTNFANPLQRVYSWNRSFSSSGDAFSSENLAFYFGFASELQSLINKNPNQDFMAAPMPQIRNNNLKLTSARVLGIAISSASKNFNTAFTAAGLMSSGTFAADLATALVVAPARRDLLAVKPTDAFSSIFYPAALYARTWLDPSPPETNKIFNAMVEGVISNTFTPDDAVKDASAKLGLLLLAR